MQPKRLAARAGFLPALGVLMMTSLFVVAGTNAAPASAFVKIPNLPVSLPLSLTTGSASVAAAEGSLAVIEPVAGGVAVTGAAVAAAPIAAAAGAALAAGGAVYMVWKWKSGHSSSAFDTPAGEPAVEVNTAG